MERGKKDFKYIEKVAVSWAEEGITTPKQAQKFSTRYDRSVYSIMNSLGRSTSPTAKELEFTDRQVSICVKDGHGPYHYDVVKGLIQAAKDNHIDYAADVYPYYGSDADAALSAGIDARHGLIGPGVYASHGY